MTLHSVEDPKPNDPEPTKVLTLEKVQILGLGDPDEVLRNTIMLVFNRPLTWWEEQAATRLSVTVEPGASHASYRFDITQDQAYPKLRGLIEQIRSTAVAGRQGFLERYDELRHAEEQINEGLTRYPF